jgi:PPK2 family polyphosphate:nucleotide phosphotransferase
MFEPPDDSFRIPFDGSFRIVDVASRPPKDAPDKKKCRKDLNKRVDEISDLQRILYAHNRHAVLLVFQALDAAGKDSTIRAVASGINPAGCQVSNFKQPSAEELDHDFLWRSASRLPERGRIGIFNRSYYEEVLVVRVHPEYLAHQRLPEGFDPERIWEDRFDSIRDREQHLARNGTVILKFWLNVSRQEQKRRFLARIDVPEKNWKFSAADVRERAHWDAYMHAYEEALRATSRPWAPWFAIPADDKPFMRLAVAKILRNTLKGMELHYPEVDDAQRARLQEMRALLEDQ